MTPAPSTDLSSFFRYTDDIEPPVFPKGFLDWDTSAVTHMVLTFAGTLNTENTTNFDIGHWDVGNVVDMRSMFYNAVRFNQDLSDWDTGNVARFGQMFALARSFNQDISSWDVSSAQFMTGMFRDAEAFDQSLGAWDISSLRAAFSMFDGTSMSMSNFDATLEGWARLDPGEARVPTGVTLGAEGIVYSNSRAFNTLTDDYGWRIQDATFYLDGTDEDDTIDGSADPYGFESEGRDGDDQIIGSDLADTLSGGDGDDTLEGGLGTDVLLGGLGDDFLFGARVEAPSDADLADRIYGGFGNDSLVGGHGNDELRGDGDNDTIIGGFGSDSLYGGTGDDILTGSALGDVLFGGGRDDFLNGGFGSDRLNGGFGADRFFHLGIEGHGSDWIQDYSATEGDVLFYGGAATADQFQVNFAETPSAGAEGIAEAFIIYQPTGHILWALVDGQSQTDITLRIGTDIVDLLA